MIFFTPASSAAFSSESPPSTLLRKYFLRIRHRFADVGVSGEMHDRIGPRQYTRQRTRVQNIALDEFEARRELFVAGAEIVEDDDFMAGAFQCPRCMTADVSRAANHQNNHCRFLSCVEFRQVPEP